MIGWEGRRVVKEKGPEAHREREVRGEVHANYVGREADGIFYLHDKGCVFHLARPQGAMCSGNDLGASDTVLDHAGPKKKSLERAAGCSFLHAPNPFENCLA
jgi:hypothetical protein